MQDIEEVPPGNSGKTVRGQRDMSFLSEWFYPMDSEGSRECRFCHKTVKGSRRGDQIANGNFVAHFAKLHKEVHAEVYPPKKLPNATQTSLDLLREAFVFLFFSVIFSFNFFFF